MCSCLQGKHFDNPFSPPKIQFELESCIAYNLLWWRLISSLMLISSAIAL